MCHTVLALGISALVLEEELEWCQKRGVRERNSLRPLPAIIYLDLAHSSNRFGSLLHIFSPLVRKARIRSANLKIQEKFRYLLLFFEGWRVFEKTEERIGKFYGGRLEKCGPGVGGGGGVNGCCFVSEDTC